MKVAHVLSHVSAVHAGVPIATIKMVQALSRLGVEASIWATGSRQEEEELRKSGLDAHLFEAKRPRGWRRSVELRRALEEAAETANIFHVHEVWNYPQYAASRIARRKGLPYILAPRASLEPWRMEYKGFKKRTYLRLLGNSIIRNATCMHAVADAEVEGFRKAGYEGPVFVAPNGVDPKEFESMPDSAEAERIWPALAGKRVVLFMSRLSPEKGLDRFVPAWGDFKRKHSGLDAVLVLAGPDDRGYRAKVEEMVDQEGVRSSVFMAGMVLGRGKFALMSRADLFVLPSYSEGFSNALLENLAAGNPALITPGCNFPEAAEAGAGLCVEPHREALAGALEKLLSMPHDELRKMGGIGRRLVLGKYTWDAAARKIAAVYKAIVEDKGIPVHPEPMQLPTRGN